MARVLLAIVDNQRARTGAALRGLREDVFKAEPADGGRSIREIGRHLFALRRMQLNVLKRRSVEELLQLDPVTSVSDLRRKLSAAAKAVRDTIAEQTCSDLLTPYPRGRTSRPGETKLDRLAVRLNDFTNHIGAIRAMRRVLGNPVNNRPQHPQRKD